MADYLTPDDLLRATADPLSFFRPKAGPQFPPLDPAEEDSLLSSIGKKAAGGLAYAGKSLGKALGGRAIRGALGGKPRELLSVVPFSDTMGLTNEQDEVSGEDLAKQMGLLEGPGEKGTFEARDLVGPGIELALDPATYLTGGLGGALSESGKAAKAAGVLPRKLAERMAGLAAGSPELGKLAAATGKSAAELAGEPLGGLARFGVPLTDSGTVLGTGPLAQRVGKGIDQGLDALRYSAPGRELAKLFDKNVSFGGRPASTPEVQRVAREVNEAIPGARARAMMPALDVGQELARAGKLAGTTNPEIRSVMENVLDPSAVSPLEQSAAARLSDALRTQHQEALSLGISEPTLEGYAPRQQTAPAAGQGAGRPREIMNPFNQYKIGREEIFDMPGKTAGVNALSVDPQVSGPLRALQHPTGLDDLTAETQHILGTYLEPGNAELQQLRGMRTRGELDVGVPGLSPDQVTSRIDAANRLQEIEQGLGKQAGQLAGWAAGLPAERAGIASPNPSEPFFGNNILTDVKRRLEAAAEANEKAKGLHKVLAGVATSAQDAGPGARSLLDVYREAGLGHPSALTGTTNLREAAIRALTGAGTIPAGTSAKDAAAILDKLHVPAAIADDVTRAFQGFTQPEALKGVVGAFDSITALTKIGQTSFWPARYARDLMQQLWAMFVHGHSTPGLSPLDPQAWIKGPKDAYQLLRAGQPLADANTIRGLEHLSPQAASDQLTKEMFALRIAGPDKLAREADALQPGARHVAQRELQMPGEPQLGPKDILRSAVPGSLQEANPLNVAGVGGRSVSTFAPVKAGQELSGLLDDVTRGASYINLRRAGYVPEEAYKEVLKAHYDFSNLSSFERAAMRRLIPFYTWTRQNLPAILRDVVERPGGKTATAIKGVTSLRDDQGFVPDYIGEGLNLPLGKESDGTQRFLSHLDLPFEAAFAPLKTGPDALQGTLQGLLGETNPLVKGPLELASGKQFYTGRDLADLRGPTGNVLVDQAIMNSPASRFYTTGRTLLDERKGAGAKAVNLLSPARVTDVDMEKARAVEGRELVKKMLEGSAGVRTFENLSVKPEDLAKLSPEQVLLMRLYKTEEARLKKMAAQKQAGK